MGTTIGLERRLSVQYAISRALAEAEELSQVAPIVLRTLADAFEWETSSVWVLDKDGQNLRCLAMYAPNPRLARWAADMQERRLAIGVGLPGRVWQSANPLWIRDTEEADNFPRREVARAVGLGHGFAFPVLVRGTVGAVVEFFGTGLSGLPRRTSVLWVGMGAVATIAIRKPDARSHPARVVGRLSVDHAGGRAVLVTCGCPRRATHAPPLDVPVQTSSRATLRSSLCR